MSSIPAAQSAPAASNGKPADVAAAFLTAATHWPAAPKADPDVATAFDLGWQLAVAMSNDTGGGAAPDYGPPTDHELAPLRIAACARRLADRLKKADVDVVALVKDHPYPEILRQLYGAEAVLGKATELGRRMYAMTSGPGSVLDALKAHASHVDTLLVSLSSALPAHGAHSVRNSLRLWRFAAQVGKSSAADGAADFRDQGRRWHAVLSGDVAAKDVLHASDYVGTTLDVVKRVRAMWTDARKVWRGWAIVVLVLFLAGIGLIVTAGTGALNDSTAIAGATSVLTAVGLTWKAIGEFFGRQAAKGEVALWDAELDWTIAYRSTLNAWNLTPGDVGGNGNPAAAGERDHVVDWLRWKEEWPDVESAWNALDKVAAVTQNA